MRCAAASSRSCKAQVSAPRPRRASPHRQHAFRQEPAQARNRGIRARHASPQLFLQFIFAPFRRRLRPHGRAGRARDEPGVRPALSPGAALRTAQVRDGRRCAPAGGRRRAHGMKSVECRREAGYGLRSKPRRVLVFRLPRSEPRRGDGCDNGSAGRSRRARGPAAAMRSRGRRRGRGRREPADLIRREARTHSGEGTRRTRMPTIAIVGAGVAGLHLALHLQREGLDVSLYEERTPDEIRTGRLPSTVGLSPPTRARQAGARRRAPGGGLTAPPGPPDRRRRRRSTSRCRLADQAAFIGMRVHLPQLLRGLRPRGRPW